MFPHCPDSPPSFCNPSPGVKSGWKSGKLINLIAGCPAFHFFLLFFLLFAKNSYFFLLLQKIPTFCPKFLLFPTCLTSPSAGRPVIVPTNLVVGKHSAMLSEPSCLGMGKPQFLQKISAIPIWAYFSKYS